MTLGQNQEGASAHCGLGTRPNSDDDSGQPEGNASESRPGERIASHVACRGCRHFIGAFHHLCGCIERNERMHRVDLLNVGGNSAIWVWLITEQGAGLALAWACSEGQPPPAKKAKKSQKKPRKDQPLFAVQWRPGSFACPPPPRAPRDAPVCPGGPFVTNCGHSRLGVAGGAGRGAHHQVGQDPHGEGCLRAAERVLLGGDRHAPSPTTLSLLILHRLIGGAAGIGQQQPLDRIFSVDWGGGLMIIFQLVQIFISIVQSSVQFCVPWGKW